MCTLVYLQCVDKVFDGQNTREIYDQVARQIIESSLDGFNGTIFAYGQTSSGKTHTMQGSPNEPGVIPLAVEDVFDKIEHTPEREYLLRVSYMEIYNEVIKDLLNPENDNLKIHENPNVFILSSFGFLKSIERDLCWQRYRGDCHVARGH